MSFQECLQISQPLDEPLAALKVAAKGDKLVELAIQSIPASSLSGIPTMRQLCARFDAVQEEGRKAALVPADSGLVGHALGSVIAGLTIPDKGLVKGDGADARFARAEYHLEQGDLRQAVGALEGLDAYSAGVIDNWMQEAKSRLVVQTAMDMIRVHVSLLVASLT